MSFSLFLVVAAVALTSYIAFVIGMLLFKSRDAAAQSEVDSQKLLANANREVRKNPLRASRSQNESDLGESRALSSFFRKSRTR